METTEARGADTLDDLFGPPIFVVTRGDLLAEGALVDVSGAAAEAGIRWPTAMTAAAWADCVAWDPANGALQDEPGRLWDVVWLLRCRIAALGPAAASGFDFQVLRVPNRPRCTRATSALLSALVHPGDDGEPVITISLAGEDL